MGLWRDVGGRGGGDDDDDEDVDDDGEHGRFAVAEERRP